MVARSPERPETMSNGTPTLSTPVMVGLLVLPVATASLGEGNALDALVRGMWVRAVLVEPAQDVAILCVPGSTQAEVQSHRAELPEVLGRLKMAGASVVGVDLDLSKADPSDLEAAAAGAGLPVAWRRSRLGGVFQPLPAPMAITVEKAASLNINPQRAAHVVMHHAPIPEVELGGELSLSAGGDEALWPLFLEALALTEDRGPPRWHGESLVAGSQVVHPADDVLLAWPYDVAVLPWGEAEDWGRVARDKVVLVGACEAERSWSRYGSRPEVNSQAELLQTVKSGVLPVQVPAWLDVIATLVVGALSFGLRRLVPQFGMIGPVFMGLIAVSVALMAALSGLWAGLSGLAVAAICFGLAAEQNEPEVFKVPVYTEPPRPPVAGAGDPSLVRYGDEVEDDGGFQGFPARERAPSGFSKYGEEDEGFSKYSGSGAGAGTDAGPGAYDEDSYGGNDGFGDGKGTSRDYVFEVDDDEDVGF